MLKDLIAGHDLELDAIGGPIVRGGEKYGIATPITRKLMEEISKFEPRS
jgi:2-dehydropantoate 2-reductase